MSQTNAVSPGVSPRPDPLGAALRTERKELRRIVRRVRFVALAGYVGIAALAFVTGLWRVMPGNTAFVVAWAGILAIMLPLNIGAEYLFVVRPFRPVAELSTWSLDNARLMWKAVDGLASVPGDPEATLDRLGKKRGGLAASLRVAALWQLGDLASAHRELDAWTPKDALDRTRHARWAEMLAFDETHVDGLGGVRVVAEEIPDENARSRQLTSLAIEGARRAVDRGEPVLASMTATRRSLGMLRTSTLGFVARNTTPDNVFRVLLAVSCLPVVGLLSLARP
ncbi:MAG TPA: hypothetical protein VF375_10515 [Candidatus Limnocylindrales bacterium]